jgi:peptidoglycan-associated lipoprotein
MLSRGVVVAVIGMLGVATWLSGCSSMTESTPTAVKRAAQPPPNPGPLIPYTPVAPTPPPTATATLPPRTAAAPPAPTAAPAAPPAAQPAPAAAPRPPVVEFAANPALRNIQFDFDRYDIRPVDAEILDENAKWLSGNPQYLLLIEGHCDDRGTPEYNLALGERRARATLDYLAAKGIQVNRMTIVSYGKERPLCQEQAEPCRAKNRRAQFLVKTQ